MDRRRGWILLAALLAWSAAAHADRLVTRDGDVLETRGPWQVRGKLVVFTLADGTLASLRLSEVDLEASAGLARAAEVVEKAAPPAAERGAVIVLTDRDVGHVDGEPAAPAGGEGGEDGEAVAAETPAAGSSGGVQVVQWSRESDAEAGTVVLRGVIQNLSSSLITNLSVNVLLYDQAGSLVAAREAPLEGLRLGPRARHEFSVPLPHALVYDEVKFQVVGRGFRTRSQSARPPAAEKGPASGPPR